MANTGISVDDDVLEKFDRIVAIQKTLGLIDEDADRSGVIEDLMREYNEEHEDVIQLVDSIKEQTEGNPSRVGPAAPTAD